MSWLLKKVGLLLLMIVLIVFGIFFAYFGINPISAFARCYRQLIGRPNFAERESNAEEVEYQEWLRRAGGDKTLFQAAWSLAWARSFRTNGRGRISAEELTAAIEELKAKHPKFKDSPGSAHEHNRS